MFVVTIREFDRRAWVERTRYLDLGGNRFVALVDDATVFPTDAAAGAWAAMYRGGGCDGIGTDAGQRTTDGVELGFRFSIQTETPTPNRMVLAFSISQRGGHDHVR